MSYKKTITQTILPAIAKMIEIEESHLLTLERVKRNTYEYKYKNSMSEKLQTAFDESNAFLEMLRLRQQQYTKFAEKLK